MIVMAVAVELYEPQKFITEVKKRPVIWDTRLNEYRIKSEKKKAWEEICELFCKDYGSKTRAEQSEVARQLLRRWKSLRDSFQRELNRAREVKAGLRKQYLYFNRLKFLQEVVGTRSGANSNCSEDHDSAMEEAEEPEQVEESQVPVIPEPEEVPEVAPPPPRTRKVNSVKKKLLDVMSKSVEARIERGRNDEEDGDRLFLLSLVSDFKKVPEEYKIDLKVDMIQALKKWQRAGK